jgi:phosphoribosyl-ATP pyrophosphohydrolase
MEVGVYISNSVNDIFQTMLSLNLSDNKIKKIIETLRERASKAVVYDYSITLTTNSVTTENLIEILGDRFFDDEEDTMININDFVITFREIFNKKRIAQKAKEVNVETKLADKDKSDIKDINMELSNDLYEILQQMSKKRDSIGLSFLEFVEKGQKSKGKNVLGVRYLDIEADNPSMFVATMVDGRKEKISTFSFIKDYFGANYNNLEIQRFCDEMKKITNVITKEPGDIVETDDFVYNPKDIRSTFLSLVSETYPRGYEKDIFRYLDPNLNKDKFGNYYLIIGDTDVMFTSHIDTVNISGKTKINLISRIKNEQEIISSDGTTILGADGKAGVAILLFMIAHKVPGVYYFFVGEETNGFGSKNVAQEFTRITHLRRIKKCISFDRRNYYSVITSQKYEDCCSEEFASALCEELNKSGLKMVLDPTGVFTDSASFMSLIPECTNISVGYFNAHTTKEAQNITFLKRLAEACLRVNWYNLPVARVIESKVNIDTIRIDAKWDSLLDEIEEYGFNSELNITGYDGNLIMTLKMQENSLNQAYSDISNLQYIFNLFKLEPDLKFVDDTIKFEIQ